MDYSISEFLDIQVDFVSFDTLLVNLQLLNPPREIRLIFDCIYLITTTDLDQFDTIVRLLGELVDSSKRYRALKRHRQVIWGEMIPRNIYKTLKEMKKMEPTPIAMTAALTLNVVDFTYLCTDGTPEQITSILSKLFDMVEHRLENYDTLFKV